MKGRLGREWVSGMLFVLLFFLTFPKFGYAGFAWICLVPLLDLAHRMPRAKAFRWGWLFGTAAWCTIIYWIPYTLEFYGGVAIPIALLALILLAGWLGLVVGVFTWFASALKDDPAWARLVALPVVWAALEWVKNYVPLGGFPWMILGYSQFEHVRWIQISEITGPYGVSFLLVSVNVLLHQGWATGKKRSLWAEALCVGVILALVYGYGWVRIGHVEALASDRPTVKAAVLQGNIDQAVKWTPGYRQETLKIYERLIREAVAAGAKIVIWPEASVPYYFNLSGEAQLSLRQMAITHGVTMIFGALSARQAGGMEFFFNSAFVMSAEGEVGGRYDKMHLVPFGEYVPLTRWLPIEKISAVAGNFSSATDMRLLEAQPFKVAPLICYESIFPEITREAFRKGANLAVIITNDAWFGPTSAPYQHLAMAAFRAVEARTDMARAANTGISAFIAPTGKIVSTLPLQKEGILLNEIRTKGVGTFYVRFGDVFAYMCVAATVLLFVWRRKNVAA
ncbi:MAG: apolipoprotein N-acyltransferase [Nitrospirae bacterium]|nr:apolipoprotein N-acyltransferase [Nitrospirota bacterium]